MDAKTRAALMISALLPISISIDPNVAFASSDEELARVKAELATTKADLATTKDALARLEQRLDAMQSGGVGGMSAAPSGPRLPPVNADNPAISFAVDTYLSTGNREPGWNFGLQSGELFVSAPVDPFVRGYASLNGSSDEGFNIEEAALVTTALPWNLTVKGGRFFSDVGRLPHWHDEALPFTSRPESIERFFGGETTSEGVEVTWLAPIEPYFQITAGAYNAIGAENFEELQDNGFEIQRSINELTWLIHPTTYFDITDTWNVEVGGTYFTVPQQTTRSLWGVDVTLRHQPGTSGLYQGLVFGTEWFWNKELFDDVEVGWDPVLGEPIFEDEHFERSGGYAYVEAFLGRRYSLGVVGDYAENPGGPTDRQRSLSAFATWMPSEFQRLRLQAGGFRQEDDNGYQITLQWTAFLGSHSHGFANR